MEENKIYNKYVEQINNTKEKFMKQLSEINTIDLDERHFVDKKKDKEDNKKLYDVMKNNKIDDDFFTPEEKKINQMNEDSENLFHYILVAIGFIVMFLCGTVGYFSIFEIIINLFYPFIYIPAKFILCHKDIYKNCDFIYHVINNNLSN